MTLVDKEKEGGRQGEVGGREGDGESGVERRGDREWCVWGGGGGGGGGRGG